MRVRVPFLRSRIFPLLSDTRKNATDTVLDFLVSRSPKDLTDRYYQYPYICAKARDDNVITSIVASTYTRLCLWLGLLCERRDIADVYYEPNSSSLSRVWREKASEYLLDRALKLICPFTLLAKGIIWWRHHWNTIFSLGSRISSSSFLIVVMMTTRMVDGCGIHERTKRVTVLFFIICVDNPFSIISKHT